MEFANDWEEEKRWKDEVALAVKKVKETERRNGKSSPIAYYIPQTSFSGNKANYSVKYFVSARKEARDTTKHIPLKRFETHPMAFMGPGLLGFTYLWHDFMVVRDNLRESGNHNMVYVHESIHTEDEYETRALTEWMIDTTPGPYERLPEERKQTDY